MSAFTDSSPIVPIISSEGVFDMAVDTMARILAGDAEKKANTASQQAANAVRYDSQTLTDAQKRQAQQNIAVYGKGEWEVYPLTDTSVTMGQMETILNGVNSAGDHVIFDTASLRTSMYACTIYLDQDNKFYRIADMVTGFEKTGFYKSTDLLVDLMNSVPTTTGKHYTVRWDKVNAACARMNDAASITTTTTNFRYNGSVNTNYDNPFDSIYPWSGRKLCNIDVDLYRGLTSGDDITDCVTAWEGDVNFDYEDQYGVWVYTPAFFGRTFEAGNYRYFDVTDELTQGNISYPAMITGRWLGVKTTLTIDGASKSCFLPTIGMPAANESVATYHTYSKNYGGSLVDIYNIDASALLMVVEFATLNSQNAVGLGCSSLYKQTLHPDSAVTASTTMAITGTGLTNILIPNAIVDIGATDGAFAIARTYIESVSWSGNTATLTLHDAVTAATTDFVSIHGIINVKDEDIGSKSGYIGTNGYVNAYYRGECLFGNKFQYILGAYHQATTNKLWVAERGDTDNYDAIDTTKHIDTGVVLSATNGYVDSLGIVDGMSIPPVTTGAGSGSGGSSNPVGDYYYVTTTANTILLLGGSANFGSYVGLFSGYWGYASSYSVWNSGSRPRLKNP